MAEAIDPRWAWEPYEPSAKHPSDLRKVCQLSRRATFGATLDEMEAALKSGPQQTIDQVLRGGAEAQTDVARSMVQSIVRANNGQQLRAWWLYRMLYGP